MDKKTSPGMGALLKACGFTEAPVSRPALLESVPRDPIAGVTMSLDTLSGAFPILTVAVERSTLEFHRLGALLGKMPNPNRVPSKKAGRKGTRRAWKRAHPPGWGNLHSYFEEEEQTNLRDFYHTQLGETYGG